ncbi:MAG: F0F1 ATP synthase subunit A [Clostridia bacterium]|nr:F0F1 ATP synthase subunit A [Clostridia bacterium]
MGEPSEPVIKIFGILDVTGEVIAMWLIIAAVALLSFIATRRLKERPGKLQNMLEAGVEYLDNFLTDLMGKKNARRHMYFLGSLFCFIIIANYSGLLPGVGMTKYVKAPTSSLSVTLGLGAITFLFLQVNGFCAGPKRYYKHFFSPFPLFILMILDEIIKPISLALRLFGNVFGEESVTENLYNLFPVGPPLIMMLLSLLFCAIQAMVFTMLTASYLNEFIEEE